MSVALEFENGRAEMAQIVNDVFTTMLSMEIVEKDEVPTGHFGSFTATVQFLGETKGVVMLHCSAEQAREFTFRMLGDMPEEINSDVFDVLGELANIIGGNLKSLFSPGVALSLPLVAEGNDYHLHFCDSTKGSTVAFASEVGTFHVSLVHIIEGRSAVK